MSAGFRPLTVYDKASVFDPPSAASFASSVSPVDAWPVTFGSPGCTSRSSAPLVHDRLDIAWDVPLGEVANPTGVLLGDGLLVVEGQRLRGVWDEAGQPRGSMLRGYGMAHLDGVHLLADDIEGGLCVHALPRLERRGQIMLALPGGNRSTRQLLAGPDGVWVLVSGRSGRLGPPPDVVVEVVRVIDWAHERNGMVRGLAPLAGGIREADARLLVALARSGPVIATPEGLTWCDWRLEILHEHRVPLDPLAISVDGSGRAYLIATGADGGCFLLGVSPGQTPVSVDLPWQPTRGMHPPIVSGEGPLYLTHGPHVLALHRATLAELWRRDRAPGAAGVVTANGFLLLADESLRALSPDGRERVLWAPKASLTTTPILSGERIYVASATGLYALAPG